MSTRWIYFLGLTLLCSHETVGQNHSSRVSKKEVKEALTKSPCVSVFFTCHLDASLTLQDSDMVFSTNNRIDTCERYLAWYVNPDMSFEIATIVNGTLVNNTTKAGNNHLTVVKRGKDIFIEHYIGIQIIEMFRVISLESAVNKDNLQITDYTLRVQRIGIDLSAE